MTERLVTLPALNALELRTLLELLEPVEDLAHFLAVVPDSPAAERVAICRSLRTAVAEALLQAEREVDDDD